MADNVAKARSLRLAGAPLPAMCLRPRCQHGLLAFQERGCVGRRRFVLLHLRPPARAPAQISHQRAALVGLLSTALRALDAGEGDEQPPSLLPLVEAVISFDREEVGKGAGGSVRGARGAACCLLGGAHLALACNAKKYIRARGSVQACTRTYMCCMCAHTCTRIYTHARTRAGRGAGAGRGGARGQRRGAAAAPGPARREGGARRRGEGRSKTLSNTVARSVRRACLPAAPLMRATLRR